MLFTAIRFIGLLFKLCRNQIFNLRSNLSTGFSKYLTPYRSPGTAGIFFKGIIIYRILQTYCYERRNSRKWLDQISSLFHSGILYTLSKLRIHFKLRTGISSAVLPHSLYMVCIVTPCVSKTVLC